jgi:hypothetical protein
VGRITRRLEDLEHRSREQAKVEIRQAWDRLSDEELALILAPFHFGREPTSEEAAARSSFEGGISEALIARAIAYREDLAEEEVSHRLGEVMHPVLERRRGRILDQLRSLEGGS